MDYLPSPQQLRYLLALSKTGHFGEAADMCSVTQSTLSAGILALEKQLNAPILDRSVPRRPAFTALGCEILAKADAALRALEEVTAITKEPGVPGKRPLRIGILPTVSPFLLPHLIPALKQKFSPLQLRLREGHTPKLLNELARGNLDMAVFALPCFCPGIETISLEKDAFLLALPPHHPLARRKTVMPGDIDASELILLEDGNCLRDQSLAMGITLGAREENFTVTGLYSLTELIEKDMGTGIITNLCLQGGLLKGKEIITKQIAAPFAFREISLGYRPSMPHIINPEEPAKVIREILQNLLQKPLPLSDLSD